MIAAVALKLFQEEKLNWKAERMGSKQQWKERPRTKDRKGINDSVNSAVNILLEHTSCPFFNQ